LYLKAIFSKGAAVIFHTVLIVTSCAHKERLKADFTEKILQNPLIDGVILA
jgi:hypothetical protein